MRDLIDREKLLNALKSDPIGKMLIDSYNLDGFIKAFPFPDTEQFAKNAHWIEKNNGSLHYCSECGFALMDSQGGEPPYMGYDYHRKNDEHWTCCPGWNGWLMNYCPNCGAKMENSK